MAIPSRQIGWGTEENLLWQISKQLETLTNVTYNISNHTTTTTTTINPNWSFVVSTNLQWPVDTIGYTLYTGAWTNIDDGNTTDPINYAGTFYTDGVADTQYYLSTNGYIYGVINSLYINGNGQDLFLTAGSPLLDGDIQNFWYKNDVYSSKWKTSILVYCGHCCGSPSQETPYSYILNIYKDGTTQYVETRVKTVDGGQTTGNAGPNGPWSVNSGTASQVWSSTDDGATWTYLGYGTIQ